MHFHVAILMLYVWISHLLKMRRDVNCQSYSQEEGVLHTAAVTQKWRAEKVGFYYFLFPYLIRDFQTVGEFWTSPQHSLYSSSFANNSMTLESLKVGYAYVLTINPKDCLSSSKYLPRPEVCLTCNCPFLFLFAFLLIRVIWLSGFYTYLMDKGSVQWI